MTESEKWKRTALLVIDMQNDCIREDGPVRVNGGKAILPNVIEAVQVARQRGILIIWVVREHDPKGRDVELFRRHLYGDGKLGPVIKGSLGAELVEGLVIKEEDYKLVKTRFSAFFNTHLHSVLQGAGIDSLVITGVQTPDCIRQTVFDAVALDYPSLKVIVDATAAATPEIHTANILDMKNVANDDYKCNSVAVPVALLWKAMAEKWNHTALLVIDMQTDFIHEDGHVRVNGGKAIVPNVIAAVQVARQRGILVVREHDPKGRDVELFRRHLYHDGKLGPTVKGSLGAELVEGLVIKEGDYKLVKTRFSAFFNTHLHSVLQGAGIDSLVITGVQTPNCIRQTVFDAVALDYPSVKVIVDATAAATPEVHAANIFDMKNVGVATPTLKEWSEHDA
ncbi:hypothetical protein G4B88_022736 [Cannabis sativa]|uniref:Isochorismatase-like domain-containing protein n=1 Tax=Cannabis sativa TaxID=3483 RepID=A0A7J6HWM0_CANSA|nr:hypothetical protein G4B88_022736 [Cannabis sativa]